MHFKDPKELDEFTKRIGAIIYENCFNELIKEKRLYQKLNSTIDSIHQVNSYLKNKKIADHLKKLEEEKSRLYKLIIKDSKELEKFGNLYTRTLAEMSGYD